MNAKQMHTHSVLHVTLYYVHTTYGQSGMNVNPYQHDAYWNTLSRREKQLSNGLLTPGSHACRSPKGFSSDVGACGPELLAV